VNWEEWHLAYCRLTPEQIATVRKGGVAFVRPGGARRDNREDRVLFFDNLAVFSEQLKPLTFAPRPQRGIAMLPGRPPAPTPGRASCPSDAAADDPARQPDQGLPDLAAAGGKGVRVRVCGQWTGS